MGVRFTGHPAIASLKVFGTAMLIALPLGWIVNRLRYRRSPILPREKARHDTRRVWRSYLPSVLLLIGAATVVAGKPAWIGPLAFGTLHVLPLVCSWRHDFRRPSPPHADT